LLKPTLNDYIGNRWHVVSRNNCRGGAYTTYAISHRYAINPWQIFRKRPQILYFDVGGGGATDLTIADSTHSHSADNAVLTSSHLLTVADATHAHSADNVALSTAILLALADAPAGGAAPTVRLEKGSPVPRSSFVVLNSGDYALDALVECARADAPNIGYCAFLCALILEIEQ
jgi:hypothetical protein